MKDSLVYLWRHHPVRSLAFAAALAAVLFFAIRLVVFSVYWADPAHRNQRIEPWMTPRYVAMSWHVPPEVVGDALGLDPDSRPGPVSLDRIAQDRGVPVTDLIAALEAAIAAQRATDR